MIELASLEEAAPDRDSVVTIGTFDGVHRGHQQLLCDLVREAHASGWLGAAVTFHPHPRAVLRAEAAPTYLSLPAERSRVMAQTGLDLLVVLNFTRTLAETPAEAFMEHLCQRLRMRALWVGRDFALGRGREGDVQRLEALAPGLGYALRIVPPLYEDGQPISSTRIRALIAEGDVAGAARLLGRHYALEAEVVPGFRRGRTLGFRTANLRLAPEQAVPPNGVYAVFAVVDGQRWPSVANIGIRPSFDAGERLLEVHLLGFEGDLYGRRLRVEFAHRLRPERRFASAEALVAQVEMDMAEARRLLGSLPQPWA